MSTEASHPLTPASFVVLGLLEGGGESTAYGIWQSVASELSGIWSVRRSQLYRESERLASGGYLLERREQGGRRRRHYAISELGREALHQWLAEAPAEPELRDPGILKLYFGSPPQQIAKARLPRHTERLRSLEVRLAALDRDEPQGFAYALEAEVELERAQVRFFSRLLAGERPR